MFLIPELAEDHLLILHLINHCASKQNGMRYLVEISYDGSNYCGWQNQPNGLSIQETIENRLSVKLQEDIRITGCCRTDSGVHALKSYFHFDLDKEIPLDFNYAMNHLLPPDISVNGKTPVDDTFHARFDATERAYIYKIHSRKNPFKVKRSFFMPQIRNIDPGILEKAAEIISQNREFGPFCKTMSDAKTMFCEIKEAHWQFDPLNDTYEFHISSNRFLRGMVRLIVGACLQIGMGKMDLEELKLSFSKQQALSKPWSVGAEGLYLKHIKYPGILEFQ